MVSKGIAYIPFLTVHALKTKDKEGVLLLSNLPLLPPLDQPPNAPTDQQKWPSNHCHPNDDIE